MSLTIGIYDLFAYTIPGLLYFFVIFMYLWKFRVFQISIDSLSDTPSGIAWLVFIFGIAASHLLGHLLDYFAQRFVFKLLRRKKDSERALHELKQRYPNVDIRFDAVDWNLLFTLLRERNQDHTRVIDSFEANSIMLRNICFGLLWLGMLQIFTLVDSFSIFGFTVFAGTILLVFVAHQRSRMFHRWFIVEIFEASLNFGSDLNEVIYYRNVNINKTDLMSTKRKAKVKKE
jgi:hypothetical protein